jgi:predicted nucleotidyltransferase
MQKYVTPVWQNQEFGILWAGVFGSVVQNRAHVESDVDILIILKES